MNVTSKELLKFKLEWYKESYYRIKKQRMLFVFYGFVIGFCIFGIIYELFLK